MAPRTRPDLIVHIRPGEAVTVPGGAGEHVPSRQTERRNLAGVIVHIAPGLAVGGADGQRLTLDTARPLPARARLLVSEV